MKLDRETYRLSGIEKHIRISMVVGLAGILLSIAGFFIDSRVFFHAYLTSFTFWVSIGLGALFIVMLHHLVNAVWSVVVRRIAECLMMTLPVMAICFIPVIFGIFCLYEWSHLPSDQTAHHSSVTSIVESAHAKTMSSHIEETSSPAEHDPEAELLVKKQGYLNTPFFIIRTIFYFALWSLLATMLYNTSLKQDKDGYHISQERRMRIVSAPGMILFALSVSFAAFDWLMSLDPLWYSTIYGVYYFSGCIVAIMAVISVFTGWLRSRNILADVISPEHYHTFGKLLFGFLIFWAYMAFSQYLLIWYANIPEETAWYHQRWVGGWKFVTILIAVAHFVIPFIALMPQAVKKNPKTLGFFAVWILVMHWIDLYWNIQPNLYPDGAGFSWMDAVTMMALGGVFCYFFLKRLSSNAILTFNDPKLEESIRYVN